MYLAERETYGNLADTLTGKILASAQEIAKASPSEDFEEQEVTTNSEVGNGKSAGVYAYVIHDENSGASYGLSLGIQIDEADLAGKGYGSFDRLQVVAEQMQNGSIDEGVEEEGVPSFVHGNELEGRAVAVYVKRPIEIPQADLSFLPQVNTIAPDIDLSQPQLVTITFASWVPVDTFNGRIVGPTVDDVLETTDAKVTSIMPVSPTLETQIEFNPNVYFGDGSQVNKRNIIDVLKRQLQYLHMVANGFLLAGGAD